MIIKGVITALVTPFNSNGDVDYKSLKNLINYQIQNNVKNLLILGTTGESPTIDNFEREKIISFSKKVINKRCTLIVGTGSNNLKTTIQNTLQAKKLGADACLIVTPYYNKCSQNSLYIYYKYIDILNIPYIVYNVPSRTGVNIEIETYKKLVQLKNIVGIKEANSNIDHIQNLFNAVKGKTQIFSGNDNLNYVFKCMGASGFISVTSNAFPKHIVQSYESNKKCLIMHNRFYEFNKLMFVEPNPVPIKYALSCMDLIKENVRMPLGKLSKQNKIKINKVLKELI